jgi:hypothetical protein
MRRVLFIALAWLLTACTLSPGAFSRTPTPTCAQYVALYAAQAQPLVREWHDAIALAEQTPRLALSTQIARLQEIRQRSQGLTAVGCATTAQAALDDSMRHTIDGYLAFLGQRPQSEVAARFRDAATAMEVYRDELRRAAAEVN